MYHGANLAQIVVAGIDLGSQERTALQQGAVAVAVRSRIELRARPGRRSEKIEGDVVVGTGASVRTAGLTVGIAVCYWTTKRKV